MAHGTSVSPGLDTDAAGARHEGPVVRTRHSVGWTSLRNILPPSEGRI